MRRLFQDLNATPSGRTGCLLITCVVCTMISGGIVRHSGAVEVFKFTTSSSWVKSMKLAHLYRLT